MPREEVEAHAADLKEDVMRLAEGTPPADGAKALSRIGHSWGDLHPFAALGQPDAAPCSAHQPAHAGGINQPTPFLSLSAQPHVDCLGCMDRGITALSDPYLLVLQVQLASALPSKYKVWQS